MEIAFVSKKLRDLCVNDYLAAKAFGDSVTERLITRLADISALENGSGIFELPGNPRKLSGDRIGQVAINLVDGYEVVFERGHGDLKLINSCEIDWSRVRRIKILAVEKGHD